MKPPAPQLPDQASLLAERFGRTADGGTWSIKIFRHPHIGFFCYSMRISSIDIGNGLEENPLLHGRCETIADAIEAGIIQIFRKAKRF